MKCPICNQELIVSKHTDLIYNCNNLNNHYSRHVRQMEDKLVIAQEDFTYSKYMILKVVDIYLEKPKNYLVAEMIDPIIEGEPIFRWHFEWSAQEFDNFFPNFNPKDINSIINKLEILDTFY